MRHSFGDAGYRLGGQAAVIVAQAVRGASDVQLSRSGRSEKGVGVAGGQRDKKAAKTFFRNLLKGLGYVPRVIITDKLKSYSAAKQK